MLRAYLQYRKRSKGAKQIQSPFVKSFYSEVVEKRSLGENNAIESLRKKLKKDSRTIQVTDLGAGSKKSQGNERAIKEIASNAAIPKKQGELIARMIRFYQIKNVLELGTSIGLGSAYLAMAAPDVKVRTIEGCPQTAGVAKSNFEHLGIKNVISQVGEFTQELKKNDGELYDLIYIDGNHRLNPTVEYFEFALEHTNDDAFIIFDDIHWSREMEEAWEIVKSSKRVKVSMDFFRFGIICKHGQQTKEDFILKF